MLLSGPLLPSLFFECRRLGETTVVSPQAFNPLYHATRETSISFRTLTGGTSSASIRIPWTKTTKQEGGTIILTSRSDDLCPVNALWNHLTVNSTNDLSLWVQDGDRSMVTYVPQHISLLSSTHGNHYHWTMSLATVSVSVAQLLSLLVSPQRSSQQQEVGLPGISPLLAQNGANHSHVNIEGL